MENPRVLLRRAAEAAEECITLDEASHTYNVDGLCVRTTVTSLLKHSFPDTFHGESMARRHIKSWRRDKHTRYHQLLKYLELSGIAVTEDEQVKEIVKFWAKAGRASAAAGTRVHAQIQRTLEGLVLDVCDDATKHALAWLDEVQKRHKMVPSDTEFSVVWRRADGTPVLGGQIDLVMANRDDEDDVWLVDWKTCSAAADYKDGPLKLLKNELTGGSQYDTQALAPFHDVINNKANKYAAQLNIYRLMLKQTTGMVASRLIIVQLDPEHLTKASITRCPVMQDEAAALLATLEVVAEDASVGHPHDHA